MSSLLLLSQLLVLRSFNSLSVSINRVWTHFLYLTSPFTLSQLSRSVKAVLICWFTSFNFCSSSWITSTTDSSATAGSELVLSSRWECCMCPKEVGRLPLRELMLGIGGLRGEMDASLPVLLSEEMEKLRWRSVYPVGLSGMEAATWLMCFWRASCWEWRIKYFCRANALSGDFCIVIKGAILCLQLRCAVPLKFDVCWGYMFVLCVDLIMENNFEFDLLEGWQGRVRVAMLIV